MTRAAINCESCDFSCRSKPSLQRHQILVHTSNRISKEKVTKKRKIPIVTCTECHSTFTSKAKMKKHVNEEHEHEERQEEQNESPPRKEAKKEDLNVRITIDQKQDTTAMEETPVEEKETEEIGRVEEVLDLRRRIYDQNKRVYDLERKEEILIKENQTIKEEATCKIKQLEENIQQEAKSVKNKLKNLKILFWSRLEL